MGRSRDEDMGELLVLSMDALRMIQVNFAKFLGVSSRTMRRWVSGGVQLPPSTLTKLATAVHATNPALAARLAAYHGYTLADLGLGLTPDQLLAYAMTVAAANVAEISPRAMRPALAAALAHARAAGLTLDAAYALLTSPARAGDETASR